MHSAADSLNVSAQDGKCPCALAAAALPNLHRQDPYRQDMITGILTLQRQAPRMSELSRWTRGLPSHLPQELTSPNLCLSGYDHTMSPPNTNLQSPFSATQTSPQSQASQPASCTELLTISPASNTTGRLHCPCLPEELCSHTEP